LLCDADGDVSAEDIDTATVPQTYYPYPSNAPLCVAP
jgi:hypothetical protein